MKNFSILLIAISIVALQLTACKKGLSQSDYLECRINGKKWRAYSGDFKHSAIRGIMFNNGKTVVVTGSNELFEDISVSFLSIENQIKVGIYKLFVRSGEGGKGSYSKPIEGKNFTTLEGYEGELNIKLIDKEKRIISGTFYFNAIDEKSNETVTITDGKFQIMYQNQ